MTYYQRERSGIIKSEGLGLLHVYYGEGVGKTTRAAGLAIRAAGEGFKVVFVQFMKSGKSGEAKMLRNICNIDYFCPGPHPFILSKGPDRVHFEHAERALLYAYNSIKDGNHFLICDEILNTLIFGLLSEEDLISLADKCRGRIELIMTGRNVFPRLLGAADYVTEFVLKKHPYYRGVRARKGVEY